MTVPQLWGPSPTCWLSWQRGGGRRLLVVATQVGGWADDGAWASLSVTCLLVRQRRLAGADDGASALLCDSGDSPGRMTVPQLCGPSPTCWLSWQRGGGRSSLVVATQVGGWADDGAWASLSVTCSLVRQRRLAGADDGASALWAILDLLAELAAGRRTVLACCRDTSRRLGGLWCLGFVVCPLLARATAAVAGWRTVPWHHLHVFEWA